MTPDQLQAIRDRLAKHDGFEIGGVTIRQLATGEDVNDARALLAEVDRRNERERECVAWLEPLHRKLVHAMLGKDWKENLQVGDHILHTAVNRAVEYEDAAREMWQCLYPMMSEVQDALMAKHAHLFEKGTT